MKRLFVIAAILIAFASPVRAATNADSAGSSVEAPMFSRIAYDVYWSGFHIADVLFTLNTGPGRYNAAMSIHPQGVLKWMSNFTADLSSEGTFLPGGVTKPTLFKREWKSTKKDGVVTITHDPKTGVASTRYVETKDGVTSEKTDNPEVTAEMRTDVVDPLAVLVAMRHKLLHGQRKNLQFSLYDGKRRFDLTGDVQPTETYQIMERDHRVVPMVLDFQPIAGFNKRQDKGWREAEFRVYFSDDARSVPLQIMLDTMLGGLVLNLKDTCQVDNGDCQLVLDERK